VKDAVKSNVLALCESETNARLLDCGCADGEFTISVARHIGAGRVVGLDIMEPNVKSALSRGVEASRVDLNTGLPFPDASFDVVVANEVIQYLFSPDAFLKEIRRVLKGGGYAVLSTTNLSALHNVVLLAFGRQPPAIFVSDEVESSRWDKIPTGQAMASSARFQCAGRFFTLGTLVKLVRFHGFTVERVLASGYYPLPMFLARVACAIEKTHSAYITLKARKK